MPLFIYMSTLCFFAITFELIFGSFGVVVPLTALVIFYETVCFGARRGVPMAILSGMVIDLLYSRPVFLTPIALVLISALAVIWLYRSDARVLLLNTFPGALVAIIYALLPLLAGTYPLGLSLDFISQNLANLLLAGCLAAFGLPFLIAILDTISEGFEFALYRDAKDKLLERR